MRRFSAELLDRLAQEYALGTLHGGARRRFETLMRESAEVARAAAAWQQRLTRLAGSVPPIEPSSALWAGLQDQLFGAPAPSRKKRAWPWAAWGLPSLGGALAGAVLCVLVLQSQPQWLGRETVAADTLPASYVGLLADAAGTPSLLASATRQGRLLHVKLLQPLQVPAGQVARLYALPGDGRAPFAVGVVPASGKAALPLPDSAEHLFARVPRLGVRLEPAAPASPLPAPAAGNFAISGPCVKMW